MTLSCSWSHCPSEASSSLYQLILLFFRVELNDEPFEQKSAEIREHVDLILMTNIVVRQLKPVSNIRIVI